MATTKKKSPGRPRNEHRTATVFTRIREAELLELDACATDARMTRSEYMRSLIMRALARRAARP